MAKWGEGDPRKKNEQRADATNVNNWHKKKRRRDPPGRTPTERDASNWSTKKKKTLLLPVRVESEEKKNEVTEVSKLDGEASINNRKGKLIFFYEWAIKLAWTGTKKNGVKYKGYVEIPNLSDENDIDEVEILKKIAKDEPDTTLKTLMKQEGAKKIRDAMKTYISTLKTEFTQGMILPTVNGEKKKTTPQVAPKAEDRKKKKTMQTSSTATSQSKSIGVKIPTCKISLKDTFLTSPEELYRVFITQEMVQAFTHAQATLEADKGGKFQLLDGSVTGEFVDLVSTNYICCVLHTANRKKKVPLGHFATITLNFTDKGGETEVCLEGKGIKKNEEERTKQGWQRYYKKNIKQTFGYGARLF
ncbi:AHSA1 ATPase, partial [Probosciger aterrimus]|nr:AHSA1 ATPase [Probosciger aterrimus]